MTRLRPAASRRGFGAAGPATGAAGPATGAAGPATGAARPWFVAAIALALAAGLALRLVRLDQRPMHNDEANQALKFGELLERREYTYDAFDHHGPTLYYLTLPLAWLRGQTTLAATDEWTLRGVPVAFGAATILLVLLLPAGLGRTAGAAAAVLMAVSPAMVFYSRMYIQESMFACFTLAFAIALGRAVTEGGVVGVGVEAPARWPLLAGVAAGLAIATKETAVIMLPASLAAGALAWWSLGSARPRIPVAGRHGRRFVLTGVVASATVAALFYSSFFTHPGALLDPLRAAPTYFDRGVDPADHLHRWHYYLGILGWSSSGGLRWTEALILGLAAIGAVSAWGRPDPAPPRTTFWHRYLTLNAALGLALFSAIPYKTPWNLLPFFAATILVAGLGFSTLMRAARWRGVQVVLTGLLAAGAAHLGWEAWRASVVYAADPRNPYVYAQTVPDAVRMAARIRALAALHTDRENMLIQVIAPPHEQWPLPWYLRKMPQVGYWPSTKGVPVLAAPVIVGSMDDADALDAALGDRYVSEFFGVRPEVLVTLYVERGLWERFLTRQALGGP
jgi:uncharacterized protein (TIGR03663 family)